MEKESTKNQEDIEKEIHHEIKLIDVDITQLQLKRAKLEKDLNKLYSEWR